ncbi:hypothetical protein ACFWA5_43060 [Streptomyces mirabilis]
MAQVTSTGVFRSPQRLRGTQHAVRQIASADIDESFEWLIAFADRGLRAI